MRLLEFGVQKEIIAVLPTSEGLFVEEGNARIFILELEQQNERAMVPGYSIYEMRTENSNEIHQI
jgi:hypothetical protein